MALKVHKRLERAKPEKPVPRGRWKAWVKGDREGGETIFARFILALGESAISDRGDPPSTIPVAAPLNGATMPASPGTAVKSRRDSDASLAYPDHSIMSNSLTISQPFVRYPSRTRADSIHMCLSERSPAGRRMFVSLFFGLGLYLLALGVVNLAESYIRTRWYRHKCERKAGTINWDCMWQHIWSTWNDLPWISTEYSSSYSVQGRLKSSIANIIIKMS